MDNTQEIVVTKTYTLTLEQVGKLAEMELELGKKKSELVRDAIDHYYAHFLENEV